MGLFSKKSTLTSPCAGTYKKLEDVQDTVFSQKMMGTGYAVVPSENDIYAPVSGKITMIFPTQHAIGITDKYGIEYIVHVGINTVNLKRDGVSVFSIFVKEGQMVTSKDKLMCADFDVIRQHGYITDVIVVATNAKEINFKPSLFHLNANAVIGTCEHV